jgi:hypothetical protein
MRANPALPLRDAADGGAAPYVASPGDDGAGIVGAPKLDAHARGSPAAGHQSPMASGQPPRLSEAALTTLWRGRRFPAEALVTRAGVPVRVIFQGRAGRGPGPDFRGAVIAGPSGVPVRGDVELHVRSSLFAAHGHATDPAYARVVLHVVFEDDTGADTPLPGGGSAPVVALAPWVARRAGELQRWLERPLLWREPCHDAVMRLGAGGAATVLEAEGDRRFAEKVARAEDAVRASGVAQALYEGLLEALGYGANAPPLRALARLLPWARLRALADEADSRGRLSYAPGRRFVYEADSRGRLSYAPGGHFADEADSRGRLSYAPGRRFVYEALLFGAGGLLPSQRGHVGPLEDYPAALERAWAALAPRAGVRPLPAGVWKLWGVRPENAAPRRAAAAAALLDRLGDPVALLAIARAGRAADAVAPLLVAAEGWWRDHHDLAAAPCRLPPGLVGRGRALEVVLNVVLPVACATGDRALAAGARALWALLPRPASYGATRFIEEALAAEGVRVPLNARRAQGLLALRRDWCTQNGCGRCPLS